MINQWTAFINLAPTYPTMQICHWRQFIWLLYMQLPLEHQNGFMLFVSTPHMQWYSRSPVNTSTVWNWWSYPWRRTALVILCSLYLQIPYRDREQWRKTNIHLRKCENCSVPKLPEAQPSPKEMGSFITPATTPPTYHQHLLICQSGSEVYSFHE